MIETNMSNPLSGRIETIPGLIACNFPEEPTPFNYAMCIFYTFLGLLAICCSGYLYMLRKSEPSDRVAPV
ncbi:hypothetical protein Ddc_13330 [Ditylenchus destructor]|nr:hypothetical protein Ddc_13330 [Ditylenchus destructor]